MGSGKKEDVRQDLDELAEWEERQNCAIARLQAGHMLGGEGPPPPPRTWVRHFVRVGFPAIALAVALFPWSLALPPPSPDIRAHAADPTPQVTASPREPREDSYPPQAHLPVAPTPAPANPKPMPTPAVVQPDTPAPTASPTPTVSVSVPPPATPTPGPLPLPEPATPAETPKVKPTADPKPTPPQCYMQVFTLCPPQG